MILGVLLAIGAALWPASTLVPTMPVPQGQTVFVDMKICGMTTLYLQGIDGNDNGDFEILVVRQEIIGPPLAILYYRLPQEDLVEKAYIRRGTRVEFMDRAEFMKQFSSPCDLLPIPLSR